MLVRVSKKNFCFHRIFRDLGKENLADIVNDLCSYTLYDRIRYQIHKKTIKMPQFFTHKLTFTLGLADALT